MYIGIALGVAAFVSGWIAAFIYNDTTGIFIMIIITIFIIVAAIVYAALTGWTPFHVIK